LIKPARKSVKALLQKVSAIIKEGKAAAQAKVIVRLNAVLRGWGMYHRHVVASDDFNHIDHMARLDLNACLSAVAIAYPSATH